MSRLRERPCKVFNYSLARISSGCLVFVFLLTGCAPTEEAKSPSAVTVQEIAESVCTAFLAHNYVQVLELLEKIESNPEATNLKVYERINDLVKDAKRLNDGTSKYAAGIKFFCDDLKQYKLVKDIPDNKEIQKAQEKLQATTQNSPGASSINSARTAPDDYLVSLNRKYHHWLKDSSGPLTGSRAEFGIVDVLWNLNYRCSVWIFSTFDNFQKFVQVWGNTFSFNYPEQDRFGNTVATENSIYSTTCAMEYRDVFG